MSLRPLRRLEHQHGLAISGRGLHQRTPGRAACLFVGIQENGDRTMSISGGGERPDGKDHHGDPGLHIVNAGTEGAARVDAERHAGQRSQWPDSIEVSQQQHRLSRSARELGFQMIPGFFLRMEGDLAAQLLKLMPQEFTHAVQRGLVVAGRLDLHHALEQLQHFLPALPAEVKTGEDGLAGLAAHVSKSTTGH